MIKEVETVNEKKDGKHHNGAGVEPVSDRGG